MQKKLFSPRSFVCAFLLLGSLSPANAFGQTLKQVATFDLPGPSGKRFDYLTLDADDHYLISAHLAAGQTYVINLRTNKVVATVTDTPGTEGVEYIPEFRVARGRICDRRPARNRRTLPQSHDRRLRRRADSRSHCGPLLSCPEPLDYTGVSDRRPAMENSATDSFLRGGSNRNGWDAAFCDDR